MSHVPDQPVLGCVIDVVQGYGQLHSTEAGSEMTARLAYRVDEEVPDLFGKLRQAVLGQLPQIARILDGFQQGMGMTLSHSRNLSRGAVLVGWINGTVGAR